MGKWNSAVRLAGGSRISDDVENEVVVKKIIEKLSGIATCGAILCEVVILSAAKLLSEKIFASLRMKIARAFLFSIFRRNEIANMIFD